MNRTLLQTCAALALLPLISGCVAFAALPVLAGSAMFAGGNVKIRSATQRPKQASALAPAASARLAVERTAGMPVGAGSGAVLTTLTALPPPDAVRDAADPWQRFAAYAADRAARFADGPDGRSVLLQRGTQLELPRMQDCAAKVPAVVIDLDAGTDFFAPRQGLSARPGLAEGLAKIRAAGAAVVWVTALPAARVGEVAEVLRLSGLDPEGADPLLLARSGEDRKQVLRDEANKDVCVIAIAGDRKGDFDELFDYLRDPRSGDSLDFMLGAGWFIVPPPL
ncbi:MAG: hypothetical protein Q8R44_19620 [Novosphingobium sp.]|nr:hypothetical protein [Novosphingobium sp.]